MTLALLTSRCGPRATRGMLDAMRRAVTMLAVGAGLAEGLAVAPFRLGARPLRRGEKGERDDSPIGP